MTGAAKYGADFNPAILLYGKVLRSPHAQRRHPLHRHLCGGGAAGSGRPWSPTATSTSSPANRTPRSTWEKASPASSSSATTFWPATRLSTRATPWRQSAAESLNIAEEAITLIKVDYEPMPAILTAPEGTSDDASLLHGGLKTQEMGVDHDDASNVAKRFRHSLGDVQKGFAEADIVIEREFNTKTVHQGYIEPHATVAFWNQDGRLTIWLSTQAPFEVRSTVAQILDLPVSQIRVVPLEIGGGFGGKIPVYLEPVAALLSRKTGTAVKLVMSRQEVFEGTGPTAGLVHEVEDGRNERRAHRCQRGLSRL